MRPHCLAAEFALGAIALGTAILALGGCAAMPARETITVFAASSLTEAFDELADEFEQTHPGTTIVLNYAGSSTLAAQIADGAPADVFAVASPDQMDGVASSFSVFATNTLEIAVPLANPGEVRTLSDFARPELAIALCAVEVPCGAAARDALRDASVVASVDTYEQDVKAVLTRVKLGEVDAGLVYRTDVRAAAGAVLGIEFDGAPRVVTQYPITALGAKPGASEFVAFVLSAEGQRVLVERGFGAP